MTIRTHTAIVAILIPLGIFAMGFAFGQSRKMEILSPALLYNNYGTNLADKLLSELGNIIPFEGV